MRAVIEEKKKIAKGTLLVSFKLDKEVEFQPGQYSIINLINPPYNDQKGLSRHFSIVNSPTQKNKIIMATRLRDSAFKKSLQKLPIGTEVEIEKIGGHFVLPQNTQRPLVFIAGGIGITPFMSMLFYIQDKSLQHKITLLYSNPDKNSTAFLEELEEMAKKNPRFTLILTMTKDPSWEGETRHIDAAFLKEYLPHLNSYSYFIVGPPDMVDVVYKEAIKAGINEEHIKTEDFSGY